MKLIYINVGIVKVKESFMWMSPKLLTFMLMMILLQVILVSCTKDLQPNPYTTILKHMMKGNKNGIKIIAIYFHENLVDINVNPKTEKYYKIINLFMEPFVAGKVKLKSRPKQRKIVRLTKAQKRNREN